LPLMSIINGCSFISVLTIIYIGLSFAISIHLFKFELAGVNLQDL
jgi:hypothetical protein